jgi:hypothetical protein
VRDLPEDPILQRAVAKLNGAELPLISLALIGEAGKPAARRFLEFFTVNIRNRNPRAACARTAAEFLQWCGPGSGLAAVEPVHVAAYVELLGCTMSPPSVEQRLGCLWLLLRRALNLPCRAKETDTEDSVDP